MNQNNKQYWQDQIDKLNDQLDTIDAMYYEVNAELVYAKEQLDKSNQQ